MALSTFWQEVQRWAQFIYYIAECIEWVSVQMLLEWNFKYSSVASELRWSCYFKNFRLNDQGPDFVRKHIYNKHGEKTDEVRKDVEYFNNYLRDPKRPQLPEHPGNRAAGARPSPSSEPPRGDPFGVPSAGFG